MKKVSRIKDLLFKKAFCTDGVTDPLIGLAKDMLDINIAELNFKQPYSISNYTKMIKENGLQTLQQTIKDVSANITVSDEEANLVSELQVRGTNFFAERSLYYPAITFTENYHREYKKYGDLKPIYGINILGFYMFADDDDGLRQFEFWDRRHNKPFPVDFIIAYFEYTKPNFFTENQRYWRDYFLDRDLPPEAPDYIQKAAEIADYANMNEEERTVLDLLEKAEADRLAELEYAEDKGVEKGLEMGLEKGIRVMVRLGMSDIEIANQMEIPEEKVKEIKNKFIILERTAGV